MITNSAMRIAQNTLEGSGCGYKHSSSLMIHYTCRLEVGGVSLCPSPDLLGVQ